MAEMVRFEHFEVSRREDGSLYELGRGAMGITYKAFDTNLRCHVALKVINSAYLNSETAQQRFLREARAAAASAIQMSRPFSISAERATTTSTRWNLSMERRSRPTSNARCSVPVFMALKNCCAGGACPECRAEAGLGPSGHQAVEHHVRSRGWR